MKKQQVYFLGLLTLIGFPLVGLSCWFFIEKSNAFVLLDYVSILKLPTIYGLILGFIYAWFCLRIFHSPLFKQELTRQRALISSMNLNAFDRVFLSLCAGIGEEIFFRACIQHWLGMWITSILFVAIHGYLNPKNWKLSLYGLCLIPFILLLAYGYKMYGLWFCVAAHFAYDLLLFWKIGKEQSDFYPTDLDLPCEG